MKKILLAICIVCMARGCFAQLLTEDVSDKIKSVNEIKTSKTKMFVEMKYTSSDSVSQSVDIKKEVTNETKAMEEIVSQESKSGGIKLKKRIHYCRHEEGKPCVVVEIE